MAVASTIDKLATQRSFTNSNSSHASEAGAEYDAAKDGGLQEESRVGPAFVDDRTSQQSNHEFDMDESEEMEEPQAPTKRILPVKMAEAKMTEAQNKRYMAAVSAGGPVVDPNRMALSLWFHKQAVALRDLRMHGAVTVE